MHNELVDPTAKYELVTRNKEFSRLPIEFKNSKIEVWAGDFTGSFTTQHSYMLVLEGSCTVDGIVLNEGDSFETREQVIVSAEYPAHLLLFEIAVR